MAVVKFTYFKPFGKFYTEGELEVPDAMFWDVIGDIRKMVDFQVAMPGLNGPWDGPIIVEYDELPHYFDGRGSCYA